MKKRPWPIVILAFLHILTPLLNILISGLSSGFGVVETFSKAFSSELLITNWYVLALPVSAGISIYICKRWSLYTYAISMSALLILNFMNFSYEPTMITYFFILSLFAVNTLAVTYFLIPAVRNVYLHKRLRWWENHVRYIADLSCEWKNDKKDKRSLGLITNISRSGLFLSSKSIPENDSIIRLLFEFNHQKLELSGKVILHDRMKEKGFGVHFLPTRQNKETSMMITAKYHQEGKQTTQLAELYEDSLSYWVRTVIKTGKGIVPDSPSKNAA